MTHNDSIMNHCPHCDSLCLLSQSEVDMAQAANKCVGAAATKHEESHHGKQDTIGEESVDAENEKAR